MPAGGLFATVAQEPGPLSLVLTELLVHTQPLHWEPGLGSSVHTVPRDRFSRRQALLSESAQGPGPPLSSLPSLLVEVFLRDKSCRTFQV